MTISRTCLLAFVMMAMGWPFSVAQAQGEGGATPDYAAAKKHFKSGQAMMQIERYGAAVEEFTKAYETTQDGLVMGQVAVAYEKGGDYEGALKAAKVYRDALSAEERGTADALIQKYQHLIKEGKSKKLILPAEQAAGEAQAAEAAKAKAAGPDAGTSVVKSGRGSKRFYTWIAAGAAGALALSALVVGLNAQSKYDELYDTCRPSGTCSEGDIDSVKTRATVTDVLWGAAAAAAITAGVLYFFEAPGAGHEGKRKDPLEGEDEEGLVKRIHVSPVVAKGTYGVGAGLSF